MQNVTYLTSYYWSVIIFFAKRFRWQKFEVISATLVSLLDNALVGFGWFILAKFSSIDINASQLLWYYILSYLLTTFCFAQIQPSQRLQKDVMTGDFNNILLKPINPIWQYAAMITGQLFIPRLITIVVFVGYLLLMTITSPLYAVNALFFLTCGLILNIGLSALVSCLWFIILDAKGLKNTMLHVLRFFQGALFPFYLVPSNFEKILSHNPLAYSLYWPIQAMKGENLSLVHFFYAILWAAIIYIMGMYCFKKALRNYEGVGL